MRIIVLLIALFMVGCYDMKTLSVKPSPTTVTYGKTLTDKPDEDKDVQKDSFTVKQDFIWE